MDINTTNFMQELNYCVNELLMIVAELKTIKQDNIENHDRILQLNGRFKNAAEHRIPALFKYTAENKPSPEMVGTKLKDTLDLMSEMLRQKTRILKNTPQVFKDTNDMSSFN